MWILMLFLSRLFHLSFELGVQCLYACQCGMGENTILIDISRGGGLYGVFKPIAQRSLIRLEFDHEVPSFTSNLVYYPLLA